MRWWELARRPGETLHGSLERRMAWLSQQTSEHEVVANAMRADVAVAGLHTACAVTRELRPALVLGYGAISEAAIPVAISNLLEAVS